MKRNNTVIIGIIVMMTALTVCVTITAAKAYTDQEAENQSGEDVSLSEDSSDFVLLSEAVPDAILEIRYYSTYNFVGDRIDGYESGLYRNHR